MNLAKLIKGLEAQRGPLMKERDKIGDKITDLECKYEQIDTAISALLTAQVKLEDLKAEKDEC